MTTTRSLTIRVRVGPELIGGADAPHVHVAVVQPVVLRWSPEGNLSAALPNELVAKISFQRHSVPRAELGAEPLKYVGAEAVALGAQQLLWCHLRSSVAIRSTYEGKRGRTERNEKGGGWFTT